MPKTPIAPSRSRQPLTKEQVRSLVEESPGGAIMILLKVLKENGFSEDGAIELICLVEDENREYAALRQEMDVLESIWPEFIS